MVNGEKKMRFSTCSIMYKDAGLERACEEAASVGLDGIDIWMTPGMCEHLPPEPSKSQLDEVRLILQRTGLAVASITAYYTHSPAKGLDGLFRAMHVAKELQAEVVVTSMVGGTYDITLRQYVDYFSPAVQEAERLGVKIAFENHSGQPLTRTTDLLLDFLSAFPSPNLGVTIAPAHLVTAGCDVEDAIRKVGKRVFFFYAWDHIPGVDDDGQGTFIWPPVDPHHHFPGQGRLPFKRFIAALRDVGYEERGGWLNIMSHGCEAWPPRVVSEEVRKSLQWLREQM